MNRLESIKERHQQDFYVKSHPTWGKDDSASKDVEWLIEEHIKMREALDRAHVLLEKYETMI